ncbi:hypothetical protein, partial [uncultured Duncaniella sp.]|uniref:hypothetical protein n=1 Tax=uncultured Duncaniella sp. TaxID=2768039 RepID=UPI0025B10444
GNRTRFREWSDARESRVRSSRVRQTHLPVVLAGVLPGTNHGTRMPSRVTVRSFQRAFLLPN